MPHTRKTVLLKIAAVNFLLYIAASSATADKATFELKERLNRTWRSQMVCYEIEAPDKAFHKDSAVLTGPDGIIPAQLLNTEYWNETPFVKQAHIAFFVDELKPLDVIQYTLNYDSIAAEQPPAKSLQIKTIDNIIEITTTDTGIRLAAGEKTYDVPMAAAEVPGPVHGIRMLDNTWTGKSSLYGETAVASYKSEITAAGPVFAEVTVQYHYADSNVVTCCFRVVDGDNAIEVDTISGKHRPEEGWQLALGGKQHAFPRATIIAGRATRKRIIEAKQPFSTSLSAWAGEGWFPHAPMLLRLRTESPAGEIHLTSRNAGAWYEPRPLAEMADFTKWKPHTMGWLWRGWRDTRLAIASNDEGGVNINSHNGKGRRCWTISIDKDGERQLETFSGKNQTAHTPHPRLDEVKNMILEWPDGKPRNPCMFLNEQELADAGEKNPAVLTELRDKNQLLRQLDLLGEFDLMRNTMDAAGRYDALINSPEITPQERALLRAQAAYLMYRVVSPYNWSVERGYCSGNPNMTVSHSLDAGIMALALRDHPMSKKWLDEAVARMDFWLEKVVDEDGYWPESSHYARVSWANMVLFGIAASRAGIRDYLNDPKYRAAALFYEKTLTPPDPSRVVVPETTAGARVNAPYGRGVRFDAWGFGGLLARAYAEIDPAFSRVMQWSWAQSGFNHHVSHAPAGLNILYTDTGLPAAPPEWKSEFYKNLGYLLRSRVGANDENYMLFVTRYMRNADGEIWPADTGMISKWFAHGKPIASAFPRIPETAHVLMNNRVLLACNWDPEKKESPANVYQTTTTHKNFTILPETEYVNVEFDITKNDPEYTHNIPVPANAPAFPVREKTGKAPFLWQRQIMIIDDNIKGGRYYMALRDTVTGNQPTQWHFWTLSERLGESSAAANRETFLAKTPGNKNAPLRELTGDRFTAIGRFGVDLETYVANPVDTPRYTLRFGVSSGVYGARGDPTFQDLLHLQLPDDGNYFVLLYPHPADQPAPEFATLGNGKIIKIVTANGADYVFLSNAETSAKGDESLFEGTAGAIRIHAKKTTLNLAAPGSIKHKGFELTSATSAASLSVASDQADLNIAPGDTPAELTLRMEGNWELVEKSEDIELQVMENGTVNLKAPTGVKTLSFRRATGKN